LICAIGFEVALVREQVEKKIRELRQIFERRLFYNGTDPCAGRYIAHFTGDGKFLLGQRKRRGKNPDTDTGDDRWMRLQHGFAEKTAVFLGSSTWIRRTGN